MVSMHLLAQTEQLFAWYNAVFVVLFGMGLFFTFLQLLGLGHSPDVDADADMDAHVDMDADADADLEAHVDVDADADVDAHVEVPADVDADVDADMDSHADVHAHVPSGGGHGPGTAGALGQLLGLGRIPLSISLMLLCYTMGLAGWMSNQLFARKIGSPAAYFPLSLLIALLAAWVAIRIASTIMSRYLPSVLTSAMDKRRLIGLNAKATLPVDERFGQACLYDKFGTLHVVNCKVRPGSAAIEKGAEVVLIKYMPERDTYVVGRA